VPDSVDDDGYVVFLQEDECKRNRVEIGIKDQEDCRDQNQRELYAEFLYRVIHGESSPEFLWEHTTDFIEHVNQEMKTDEAHSQWAIKPFPLVFPEPTKCEYSDRLLSQW
jgi:hypothetical protein